MAKKNAKISIFEIVWYTLCVLVILWGITYVVLSLINKYNDLTSLEKFAADFKKTFGLSLYFWGLIIAAIGAVAMSVVMIAFAKTFDRAADREQRRSARLNAIKKDQEQKVVAEQKAEVVEEQPQVEEPAPEEAPAEEAKPEEPVQEEPQPEAESEQPAEEPVQEAEPEEVPVEETKEEKPAEEKAE